MSDVILKVDNISKQYRLGLVGTGTLSHDINRFWHKIRGKEDPYLKIGAVNNRAAKANFDYVWALQDINFEVKRGEILGIIGKNGAGKSTLLKILSRVTSPTMGSIKTKGRIASLLEVGTGMHPELTGRENIFLNGAILGMTKAEISDKIDEIIEFSGCQMYIDTPVKRYSSGMRVRLGFAVAAFLEPDILVVDEVLAVGDAEFQQKAIGKMQDISNTTGRTVLFVSHNMGSIRKLCTRALLLVDGKMIMDGAPDDVISNYLSQDIITTTLAEVKKRSGSQLITFKDVKIYGLSKGDPPITGEPIHFEILFDNKKNEDLKSLRLDMRIDDNYGQRMSWFSTSVMPNSDISGLKDTITIVIPKNPFTNGVYFGTIYLEHNKIETDLIENAFSFNIEKGHYYASNAKIPNNQTKIFLDYKIDYS